MLEASSVGVLETGGQQRVTAIAPSGCGPGRPPRCRSRALSMMFSAVVARVASTSGHYGVRDTQELRHQPRSSSRLATRHE